MLTKQNNNIICIAHCILVLNQNLESLGKHPALPYLVLCIHCIYLHCNGFQILKVTPRGNSRGHSSVHC